MWFEVIAILSCACVYCSAILTIEDIKKPVCKKKSLNAISFAELLEVSSASTDCYDAVGSVLKAKYDKMNFVIDGPFVDDNEIDIDEQPTSIRLRSQNVVKYFLIRFGEIIRQLRISFEHIDSFECEQIIILVNNRCSNSLDKLFLEDCKGNMLAYLTKPFPKVTHLTFSSSKNDQLKRNTNHFNFTSIFTSLHSLNLSVSYMTKSDWDYIGNCKWPSIEDLYIALRKPAEQNAEDSLYLRRFLQTNPQISFLSVNKANLNILEEANNLLPELFQLELKGLSEDYFNYQGDQVRFENVKLATIMTDSENELPGMIAFDQLDHLTLRIPNFTDKWMKFLTNQVNVTLAYLVLSTEMISISDFLTIPEVQKKLQTVTISCQMKLKANDIVSFIAKGEFLNYIDLKILMDDSEEQHLDEVIPISWDRPLQTDPENPGQVKIVLQKFEDCFPESLKRLDMNNLIKRSRVSANCMNEARETFKEKYANTMFSMCGPFEKNSQIFEDGKREIYLMNLETIKYLMRNFGHFIHRVSVSFAAIEMNQAKEIVQLLNFKSTESLETLELHSCREDILDKLKTFNNIFTLTYSSDVYEERPTNSKAQKLYKIAPNLYTLKLKRIIGPDWEFINGRFRNLRKLTVSLRKTQEQNEVDTLHVVNFLKTNPTIGVLAMESINLMLLKLTNDYLPQLESLYIANLADNYMNYNGESISFKNLQFLSIDSDDDVVPDKIVFYHLDKLCLTVNEMNDKWLDFLTKRVNPDLRLLDLTVDTITIEQFLAISSRIFRFLERVEFISPIKLKADDIKSFIENGEVLNDVILKIRMDLSERQRLNEILIDNLNVKFYLFENQEVIVDIKLGRNFVYCEQDSLNGESVSNLLDKSKLDRECLEEARAAFKAYDHFTFLFVGPFIKDEEEAIEMDEDRETVIIRNFNVCKDLLTNFGYLIRKIKVDFQQMDTGLGMQIIEAIGAKCSISLNSLKLINCKEDMLDGLNTEYENVSVLRLTSSATDPLISSDSRMLSTLFPKLVDLSVTSAELTHFYENIPILTAFDVELPQKGSDIDESHIGHFLKINPQIILLGIYYTTPQLLREVIENIPQLQALSIIKLSEDFVLDQNELIRFDKLTELSVYSDEIIEWVVFDKLEMLELFIEPSKFDDKWLEFLTHRVNKNLTRFTLMANALSKEHFFMIAEKLHNLEKVEISSTSKFTANDIVSFIEKCKYLTSIEMKIEIGESEKKRLMSILPNTWERIGQKQVEKIMLKREPLIIEGGANAENGTDGSGNTTNTTNGTRNVRATYSMQMFAILAVLVFIATIF